MHYYLRHGISTIPVLKRTCSTKFVVHPHSGQRLIPPSRLGASSRHPKGHVCEEVREVRRDLTSVARYDSVLTDACRVICKIEYFPRNVPPQNPSLERGGKKDIELSYNLPPMGRQEHTFGRSLTTLTTVVRIAIFSLNQSAYRSDGLHRINIC